MIGVVICTALFVDSLQLLINLIPFVGTVLAKFISIGAIMGFSFYLLTIGELNWKNACWLLGFGSIEILPVPWLELLPGWTAGMAIILLKKKLGSKVPIAGKLLAAK